MKSNFQFLAPDRAKFVLECTQLLQENITHKVDKRSPLSQQVLFVFVALRPMSTAMVIAGRSVHLTTLFPGQA